MRYRPNHDPVEIGNKLLTDFQQKNAEDDTADFGRYEWR